MAQAWKAQSRLLLYGLHTIYWELLRTLRFAPLGCGLPHTYITCFWEILPALLRSSLLHKFSLVSEEEEDVEELTYIL